MNVMTAVSDIVQEFRSKLPSLPSGVEFVQGAIRVNTKFGAHVMNNMCISALTVLNERRDVTVES